MTFLNWQTGRKTRSVSSAVASRRNRARYRLAAQTVEQCEDRILLASILGTAQSFAVLGASTVTNTGPTAIVGDVGVSPGSAITGFPPGVVTGGTLHAADAVATQAHADLVTAYGVLAGEVSPPANDLTGQDLGGRTLAPGVYHFASSAPLNGILTLDAQGNPNARFDFQIVSTLISGSGAAVQLINGAQADNVYFQVGSSATLGTGTAFEGNILADQSITLTTGASMLDGRALALVGAVTMDTNQINAAEADVSVTKTTAAGPVFAGNTVAYTITVSNAGPDDAQAVALSDLVPANTTFVSDAQTSGPMFILTNPAVGGTGTITGTIGTLALGASASFNVVVLVSPSTPAGTTISNTADVTAATGDPNLANNTQTATTLTATEADVSVTKTTAPGPVFAGNTIAYTITVSNAGPSDAQTVALSDLVPANTTFVSDAQNSGPAFILTNPAVGGTGTITGTIGTLASGASATFTVVLLVSPSTPDGTTIANTANVTAATTDPNLANNTQTATTNVLTPLTPVSPSVVNLQRFGFHTQATTLVVTFSMPLDSARALDVGNYRIVTLGGPGRGGAQRGHVTRVRKVVYNPVAQTVTLHMAQRLDLHNLYRITITGAAPGGLMSTEGVPLDGAGTGNPGSNFVGFISSKILAGPSPVALQASRTSVPGVTRVVRAISASAVDMLAVSGRLTVRAASATNSSSRRRAR